MYGDTRPEPKSSDSQMDSGMIAQDLRDLILAEPEAILQDTAVMAALVAASDRALGSNVVDLRAIAMARMEARLDRLEDTHRSVIAAVYENLAGTNQVHRATLLLLTPVTFEAFLQTLGTEVAQTLRVDCARLVLETRQTAEDPALQRLGETLCITEPGFVDAYLGTGPDAPPRPGKGSQHLVAVPRGRRRHRPLRPWPCRPQRQRLRRHPQRLEGADARPGDHARGDRGVHPDAGDSGGRARASGQGNCPA